MTAPPDDTTTNLHAVIAALRAERDAALSQVSNLAEDLAASTAELAARNAAYGERITQQTATIDVLKAMSASPSDAQPVFELIAKRSRELCDATIVSLHEYDGELVYFRAWDGPATQALAAYATQFPMQPSRSSISCLAIIDGQIVHVRDLDADAGVGTAMRPYGHKSQVSVPLMKNGAAIGVISLGAAQSGGFSDSQIELLRTFAEQAVIASTSAEAHRALQARTADLQESLEYQTATSDVLKVISRATFDLQPVLDTVAETAARLYDADQSVIFRCDGELRWLAANHGYPPDYEASMRARGIYRSPPDSPMPGVRAERERMPVQISDATIAPGYSDVSIKLGGTRTALGVPLLRGDEPIGSIVLTRKRVAPFTDRQIELVRTFADQAVIAIENTRLITEQREALEQQTATAEVLQVINSSPGDLAPVFDTMLEKAIRLCEAEFGILRTWDEGLFHLVAARGDQRLIEWSRQRGPFRPDDDDDSPLGRIVKGEEVVRIADVLAEPAYQTSVGFRTMADASDFRSGITLALRKDAALLGTITVYRKKEVRPFTDKHIALLQNFAAQAVIAIARLRVGTSITEGTANFLVNRRMNKSQQMRWSRRGADLLLQVRCAVYNGTLGSGLGHRFQPHANQNERSANAA